MVDNPYLARILDQFAPRKFAMFDRYLARRRREELSISALDDYLVAIHDIQHEQGWRTYERVSIRTVVRSMLLRRGILLEHGGFSGRFWEQVALAWRPRKDAIFESRCDF